MKLIPLTFDQDHTHAGREIKRGDKHPGVPAYTAEYLIAHDIAHVTPTRRSERAAESEPVAQPNDPQPNETSEE